MSGLTPERLKILKEQLIKAGVTQDEFSTAVTEMKMDAIRQSFKAEKYEKQQLDTIKSGHDAALSNLVNHPDHRQAVPLTPQKNEVVTNPADIFKAKPAPFKPSQGYIDAQNAVANSHDALESHKNLTPNREEQRDHLVDMLKDFVAHGGKDQQTKGDSKGERAAKQAIGFDIMEASGEDLAKLLGSLPGKNKSTQTRQH